MEFNDYQKAALMQPVNRSMAVPAITVWAAGLRGESAKFASIIKEHHVEGHALPKDELARKLGEILWSVAVAANELGYDLDTIAEMTVNQHTD